MGASLIGSVTCHADNQKIQVQSLEKINRSIPILRFQVRGRMICSFLDRQEIRSGRMAIMPAKKKAKTGPQASGKAKADAQKTATAEEQKAPQISGASTRIFGKTEEEATAIILQIQEEMTTAIEEASKRALEAAQGWDATNHRQGLEMAAPILHHMFH